MTRSPRHPHQRGFQDDDSNAGDLGGGLTMDVEDGSIGVQVAPGFSIDLGDDDD
jgi:hypothetical protein